jgi:hypothetical protein
LELSQFARLCTDSVDSGAIDASVVANASDIAWNQVASFPPFNGDTNSTEPTYLQWAIPLNGLFVSSNRCLTTLSCSYVLFQINGTSVELNSTYGESGAQSLALIDM